MDDDQLRGIQWRLRPELSVPLPHRVPRTKWWRLRGDGEQQELPVSVPRPRCSPENGSE
ncbi:hypothetical protein [Amycolatopsis antarctica]|uniref:hypothetical protein n=1 Tax=Amycolatopsis antarctica TaxID=1854586 RepID=UPI0013FD2FAA|nr:hypothetical protein [Amycolatopsis antarctica]